MTDQPLQTVGDLLTDLETSLDEDRGSEELDDIDMTEISILNQLRAFLGLVSHLCSIALQSTSEDGQSLVDDWAIASVERCLNHSLSAGLAMFAAFDNQPWEVQKEYNWTDGYRDGSPTCTHQGCTEPGLTGNDDPETPYRCPQHLADWLRVLNSVNGEDDGPATERQ